MAASINAGNGTITLSTAVSVADGTAGNSVTNNNTGPIWLNYKSPILFDSAGQHRIYGDFNTNSGYLDGGHWRVGQRRDEDVGSFKLVQLDLILVQIRKEIFRPVRVFVNELLVQRRDVAHDGVDRRFEIRLAVETGFLVPR